MKKINLPLTKEQAIELKCGETVLLSGTIYTARDAAHKKLFELIEKGEKLPIEIKDCVIYYAGPCPPKPGQVMNSCGPTTSGRMNAYSPLLFDMGQSASIGKGPLSEEVINAIARNQGIYFCATGGCGALISKSVVSAQVVAFPELGAEAIRRLEVKDMPLIVGIDAFGNSIVK